MSSGFTDLDIGLTVSVPLFFNKDETIDLNTLKKYLTDLCSNDRINAIYSMAYNTRYRVLADDEILEVNQLIVSICKDSGKRVYIGHPYSFNRYTLQTYLEQIQDLKVSGVSMLYPERYFADEETIIEFLKLPNKFGMKTVFHEMKLVSGFNGELINWPANLLERIFDEVDLEAVKEDSKDDEVAIKILDLCRSRGVKFILAGGGKARALDFFDHGIGTWLNGSSIFLPKHIDRIYEAFVNKDEDFIKWYMETIEKPFFKNIVDKYGWHLSHKAALEFFGYGECVERFPHANLNSIMLEAIKMELEKINANLSFSTGSRLNGQSRL